MHCSWRLWRFFFVFYLAVVFCPALLNADLARLERLARNNPNDVKVKFLLGKAYSQAGRHLAAKKVFQEILQRRRAPVVFLHLGIELAAMGNLTGAILQWTSVVEQRPNSKTAMRLLARALYKQALQLTNDRDKRDLFEQSLGWWKRILRLDPGNLRARYYAGIECYKLGRFEEAAKHWLILLRVKKTHRKTLKGLAKAMIKLGRFRKAARVAKRIIAIETSSGRKTAYGKWARSLLKKLASGAIERPEIRRQEERLGSLARVDPPPKLPSPKTERERQAFLAPRKAGPVKASPPSIGEDLKLNSIDAENLFLDGLEFMDQKKFEKALFAFLQSIDINPDFTQVYLQMGECYMNLARLAKRKSQFVERLALARRSLDKVEEKSPGSLVAHAAKSKTVILDKLSRAGFKGYHIMTAHKAIRDGREDDAFDEYLLLLSNLILEPGVFLEIGAILPRISKTHRQDLQFFLEDLYAKNSSHPWIEYLLGKVYACTGQRNKAEKLLTRFLEHFSPKENVQVFATYVKFIDHPKVSNIDRFLGVRLLIKIGRKKEAYQLLKTFLARTDDDALFSEEAKLLSDQLRAAKRRGGTVRSFRDEVRELQQHVVEARVLFDPENLSPSHLDENLLKAVRLFLEQSPDNLVARFILAWLLEHFSKTLVGDRADELRKKAEDLFQEVLSDRTESADWHYKMGLQALHWHLNDRGMAHLKLVGDILLSRGIYDSSPYCNRLLVEVEHFYGLGKPDVASSLLGQAHDLSPNSLNYYLVKCWIEFRKGNVISAAGELFDWLSNALSQSWVRRVLFCDFGLILFLAVLATTLATATALCAKYFEPLHHFVVEFVSSKGMLFSVGLALMSAIFLFFFSSGLMIFIPFLIWPMMNDRERTVYLVLSCLVFIVPLLLPISLFDNFELLRQVENLRSGKLSEAKAFFAKASAEDKLDFGLNYAYGLCCLRDGELDKAERVFSELLKRGEHEGVFVNLGVIAARKGKYDKALSCFQKALGLEAKSVPSLFDISAVHAFLGKRDKADQYLRWARSLTSDPELLGRYRSIPSTVAKLVLMDAPIDVSLFDSRFSFFSTENFLRLNANLIGFVTWFIIGGGLVAFLLFQRERMDIILARCSQCYASTCNLCQYIIDGKTHCENCARLKDDGADDDEMRNLRRSSASSAMHRALVRAYIASAILPGTGPIFTGDVLTSAFCQLSFWICLQAACGGWLLSFVFQTGPGSDVLSVFRLLFAAGALFFWSLGLVLLYRQREGIDWV